ncbi:MAG TPA: SGNH/GDSL hydrolase family protein [Bryobacteraceae bacterium]|nr:SGNH/GDSL hydrolase family protein [Bryobacteraceae bacterium]
MIRTLTHTRFQILLCTAVLTACPSWAQNGAGEHWVATWGASPQAPRALPARPPQAQNGATQNQPPAIQPLAGLNHQTVRMIVRTSIGGRRLRVEVSNAFGTAPLMVGAAHVALRAKDSEIVGGSDRALAFGGRPACAIPPGALMISDPVDLEVPAQSDLAVSLYLPSETGPPTMHGTGLHTTYISRDGNQTAERSIDAAATSQSWYWISGIDVAAPADAAALVTFGDSITDGATSTPDTNRSWPAYLSARLAANTATANVAVVNQGISGNRVLRDGAGVNALARFDRDVLAVPGVKWVSLMESINDVGIGSRTPAEAVTADDLITGLKQLADRAHMRGIKVIGCTLTPYEGAAYYSESGEVIRMAVNEWIRTSGVFDAVFDFDKVEQDADHPKQFRAGFNTTDHLHPNDVGYKAMADSVDLSLFAKR